MTDSGIDSQSFTELKILCMRLCDDPNDTAAIAVLNTVIDKSPSHFLKTTSKMTLSAIYQILRASADQQSTFTQKDRELFVNTMGNLLHKIVVENHQVFFNIFSYLLFEMYSTTEHKLLDIPEENKLGIVQCVTALCRSLSSTLIEEIYCAESSAKMCQMLFVLSELMKNEKMRLLRVAAINSILAITRVLVDNDFHDTVMRSHIADVLTTFMPGIISGLKDVALVEEKVGHLVPVAALNAWARIIVLMMEDYHHVQETAVLALTEPSLAAFNSHPPNALSGNYMVHCKKTPQWYQQIDQKLQFYAISFIKVIYHSHYRVRLQLVKSARVIIRHCLGTMPRTIANLMELLIILSQDANKQVADASRDTIKEISGRLSKKAFRVVLETFKEGFYNSILCLPRKFNRYDEAEQLAALNLVIGYIKLFGENNLLQILLSTSHLNMLMSTLMHISELDKSSISSIEDSTLLHISVAPERNTPWKRFRHFQGPSIAPKVEELCALLANLHGFHLLTDYLIQEFCVATHSRIEVTFILNATFSGADNTVENQKIVKQIIAMYIDPTVWYLPLLRRDPQMDDDQPLPSVLDVTNNILLTCLLLEGLGTLATHFKEIFKPSLINIFYPLMEKAGSRHYCVKTASFATLDRISEACAYPDFATLLHKNITYFTFQLERRITFIRNNNGILNVLAFVLEHSTIEILPSVAHVINNALVHSCDNNQKGYLLEFLNMFKVFLNVLVKWLDIKMYTIHTLPTREARVIAKLKSFQVTDWTQSNDFSDDVMGNQTAEEMYKEDLAKGKADVLKEINEPMDTVMEKPKPPLYVELTVAILNRALHFLPSKDRLKRLLVMQILTLGLEIIKDNEDDLLPMVHLIWSPLVPRFKDYKDPLTFLMSFRLLLTLGRLSTDFIRARTVKDVLPSIFIVLTTLAQDSYLKDRGSAYRFTQSFKLQLAIIDGLAKLLLYLDIEESVIHEAVKCVYPYLSNKQPLPLQKSAIAFCKTLSTYHICLVDHILQWDHVDEFSKNMSQVYQNCFL